MSASGSVCACAGQTTSGASALHPSPARSGKAVRLVGAVGSPFARSLQANRASPARTRAPSHSATPLRKLAPIGGLSKTSQNTPVKGQAPHVVQVDLDEVERLLSTAEQAQIHTQELIAEASLRFRTRMGRAPEGLGGVNSPGVAAQAVSQGLSVPVQKCNRGVLANALAQVIELAPHAKLCCHGC